MRSADVNTHYQIPSRRDRDTSCFIDCQPLAQPRGGASAVEELFWKLSVGVNADADSFESAPLEG
jgi:hypothetical protein